MEVPAVQTTLPLSQFKTNEAWMIIVPANWDYLPEDAKTEEVKQKLDEGNAYAIVSAFPGRKDVPKITDWNGAWAVIIPQKG